MRRTVESFGTWPRTKKGDPIFRFTEDANFYAHLIFNKEGEQRKIAQARKRVQYDLQLKRSQDNPNYNRMMELATKDQFFRECQEEIERIKEEERR